MKIRLALSALLIAVLPSMGQPAAKASLSEPTLNPARDEIAFIYGGDIWTAPLAGGEARLLVSHPATESRPRFSPDGKKIAFTSARTGNGDVYVLDIESGTTTRLTFDDAFESVDGWSPDGKYVYFTTNSKDVSSETDIFRVPVTGGTPMPVAADRYVPEFFAAAGPADGTIAFCAKGGMAYGQWWRHGHAHIDESEIWIRKASNGAYEKVDGGPGARELWPMWSADKKNLYFVSDRSGSENIWEKTVGGGAAPKQITQFKDGRLLWPQIAGKRIVFERDFGIWSLDVASGKSAPVSITLRGAPATPAATHMNLSSFREMSLAPDAKKVAVIVHGDVFAASTKDGGNAFRVTNSAAAESSVEWAPDSKSVVYVSSRDGGYNLFQYDFVKQAESQLTKGGQDYTPLFSPDGKMLAYFREGRELHTLEIESKKDRVVATGLFGRPPLDSGDLVWSPDSQWIGYLSTGADGLSNAWVTQANGSAPAKQVSFMSNAFSNAIQWSPDGKYLLFISGQRTEDSVLARVDLTPRTPKFKEDQFTDLFKEPTGADKDKKKLEAAPKDKAASDKPKIDPVKIDFDGIRRRMTWLDVGLSPGSVAISPDGKILLFSAFVAGQSNLYTYSLDELAREHATPRQLTSTSGFKSGAKFTPDSKEVYYLENGRVESINIDNRNTKTVSLTAEMEVNFDDEKLQVFDQAWTYLRDSFFDPKFHGVDWNAERDRFAPYAAGARTPDDLRRTINLMIGDLNASHSGISGGGGGGGGSDVGKLGLHFDPHEYEVNGRLKITEVLALSPAAVGGIEVGEYLLAVDGKPVGAGVNLDEQLDHKSRHRVVLSVGSKADPAVKRDVTVSPVPTSVERNLRYNQWVESRREYVSKISNGRLGYVHMPDMSSNSLTKLFFDLDADNREREGVVVDVRNNNGGFVNAYAIDVFARRGYLLMTPRGSPGPELARTQLGQRSLEKPTVLVTDMHSLSDAEDFTQGYRALKLGKVVGEPTAGWIIFTSGTQLIDGSNLRLPFIRITTETGQDMEGHPRPVDIEVNRPVGESYTGKDTQLDAAVRELLSEIGAKK
ncbi:MAG TPA: S41 family peptidase [Bryobacteraceae bacterium]|jgi:Tol biopolymer transport system component